MTTLVLLPGLDGTGALFSPLLAALDPAIAVHTLAYPAGEKMSYEQLTTLVCETLPAGPLVLLGESFSGPIAVAVAAAERHRVRGVILCVTFVRNPRPWLGRFSPLLSLLPFRHAPDALVRRLLLGRHDAPHLRRLLQTALAGVPDATLKQRLRAVVKVDVTKMLKELTCPIVYLQAQQDRVIPSSVVEAIRRAAPRLQVERLAGPHCLLQSRPEEAAAIIARYWRLFSPSVFPAG